MAEREEDDPEAEAQRLSVEPGTVLRLYRILHATQVPPHFRLIARAL